mgnify:CR=1 FL=1
MKRPAADRLEAEGHALIAQGHELLAQAAQARAERREEPTAADDLVPLADTPLDARTRRRLEREGRLPVVKLGRRKFTRRSALAGLVAETAAPTISTASSDDPQAAARDAYANLHHPGASPRRKVG